MGYQRNLTDSEHKQYKKLLNFGYFFGLIVIVLTVVVTSIVGNLLAAFLILALPLGYIPLVIWEIKNGLKEGFD